MSKGSFPVTSAQKQIFDAALTSEEQEKLPPPSTPGLYQPIRPPPTGKARRRQQFLEQFDPLNENYVLAIGSKLLIIIMLLKIKVDKLLNGNFVLI